MSSAEGYRFFIGVSSLVSYINPRLPGNLGHINESPNERPLELVLRLKSTNSILPIIPSFANSNFHTIPTSSSLRLSINSSQPAPRACFIFTSSRSSARFSISVYLVPNYSHARRASATRIDKRRRRRFIRAWQERPPYTGALANCILPSPLWQWHVHTYMRTHAYTSLGPEIPLSPSLVSYPNCRTFQGGT